MFLQAPTTPKSLRDHRLEFLLKCIGDLPVTTDTLKESELGKTINKLKKIEDCSDELREEVEKIKLLYMSRVSGSSGASKKKKKKKSEVVVEEEAGQQEAIAVEERPRKKKKVAEQRASSGLGSLLSKTMQKSPLSSPTNSPKQTASERPVSPISVGNGATPAASAKPYAELNLSSIDDGTTVKKKTKAATRNVSFLPEKNELKYFDVEHEPNLFLDISGEEGSGPTVVSADGGDAWLKKIKEASAREKFEREKFALEHR